MKYTGAQILIEALIKEGADTIFGYPGGVLLPIFDVLYDAKINFILVRHEQGAAHAADGYSRSTNKVGVCMATSGPGATNLVTGIATAYMDSIPMVVITGQVPTTMIGNDAFQEADIIGITRPIVKHSYLLKNVADIARVVKEAFWIAKTGRPGPVLIDIPKDISTATMTNPKYPQSVDIRSYNPTCLGHPMQIKKAVSAIASSKKPVIYSGGGIMSSGAAEELQKFVDITGIPVTSTLLGLGGFPGTHPLFLGMLGMHGTKYANYAISNADLVIAVGSRFDDRVTGKVDEFAPAATVIHIDIDPSSISKNVLVHIPIVGDAKHILQQINKEAIPPKINDWTEQIEQWKKDYPLGYKKGGKLKPQFVIEKIYEVTGGNAIITTEVGQNQMWAAQYYKFEYPRSFLSSGGLGTMGYGFPAAIGAQVANPDMVVFDIAGDGSFQMNIQELATAIQYNLPVNVAILNNHNLGMVRQWQELFFNKRYSYTSMAVQPDFVKVAEAYGAEGIRVETEEEVVPALKSAIDSKKPVVLDFWVEEEDNVFPMVPAGASLTQMLEGMA
ncbi:biosynthetic-type acetolactate synthase large subunit [bacterium]|nr:biosynthetic-type acetolactate synthase large subunit [bacterium]